MFKRTVKPKQTNKQYIYEIGYIYQEKEVKAAADSVLSEVRRKLSETSRRLEALNALVKLRKLRKVSAERKGMENKFNSMFIMLFNSVQFSVTGYC